MIILDTNVLSEVMRASPSGIVLRWLAAQERVDVFTSAVTEAEVRYGIELLPAGKRRTTLLAGAERLFGYAFAGRVLPFDQNAARLFAEIAADRRALGRPISLSDAMIAAIARSRSARLATRNAADFEHCGIGIINPWNG